MKASAHCCRRNLLTSALIFIRTKPGQNKMVFNYFLRLVLPHIFLLFSVYLLFSTSDWTKYWCYITRASPSDWRRTNCDHVCVEFSHKTCFSVDSYKNYFLVDASRSRTHMRFLRNLYDAKKDHCSRIRTPQESRKGFSRLRSTKNFLVDALRSRTYMLTWAINKWILHILLHCFLTPSISSQQYHKLAK